MIEIAIDGGGFVLINFSHVIYIRNDAGQAIIKVANNDVFLSALAYDDLLDYIQRAGITVTLDRETRDDLEAIEEE